MGLCYNAQRPSTIDGNQGFGDGKKKDSRGNLGMAIRWNNLAGIRAQLGKSQSELATLLGISTRAVQSYEQGWRTVPMHVQKNAAMLLFLVWRKGRKGVRPCWQTKKCSKESRACCAARVLNAGDLCWLVSGTRCGGAKDLSWSAKAARCQACPVTSAWMKA